MWWSPDSRFVAYVSQARLYEGGLALDVETYWLRVRRLSDNSESRVAGADSGGESYEWVTNAGLFREAKSNYGRPPYDVTDHPNEVFLVGNVAKLGWYPLQAGETILQVVSAAGGLTPWAKADSIYVLRTENGKERRIPCHFNNVLKSREKAILLQQGDVIVVP